MSDQPAPIELDFISCGACGAGHPGLLMPDGTVQFTEECQGRDDRRSDLANLVHHGGRAFALAAAAGDFAAAERAAAAVLQLRDPPAEGHQ